MQFTVDISLRELDVTNARARIEDFTSQLKDKTEEYAVRQEEQKFQDEIDALWK